MLNIIIEYYMNEFRPRIRHEFYLLHLGLVQLYIKVVSATEETNKTPINDNRT